MRETPTVYYEEYYCKLHNPRLQDQFSIDKIICSGKDIELVKKALKDFNPDDLVELKPIKKGKK